jgi:hypothetical protein
VIIEEEIEGEEGAEVPVVGEEPADAGDAEADDDSASD